jgi:hypothetical protein
VLTAALAIVVSEGALLTFFLEKRVIGMLGIIGLTATPLLVVGSFIAGGLALNQLSVNGSAGTWNIQNVSGKFNWQAILTLLAAIGIIMSVLGTHPKSDPQAQESRLVRLNDELYRVKQQIRRMEPRNACRPVCSSTRLPPRPRH